MVSGRDEHDATRVVYSNDSIPDIPYPMNPCIHK